MALISGGVGDGLLQLIWQLRFNLAIASSIQTGKFIQFGCVVKGKSCLGPFAISPYIQIQLISSSALNHQGFGMIAVAGMDELTADLKWAASRRKSCASQLHERSASTEVIPNFTQ